MRCGRIDQRRQWEHGLGDLAPGFPVALGALLGLLAVAELVARLSAKSTLHAGLTAAPVTHAGVTCRPRC